MADLTVFANSLVFRFILAWGILLFNLDGCSSYGCRDQILKKIVLLSLKVSWIYVFARFKSFSDSSMSLYFGFTPCIFYWIILFTIVDLECYLFLCIVFVILNLFYFLFSIGLYYAIFCFFFSANALLWLVTTSCSGMLFLCFILRIFSLDLYPHEILRKPDGHGPQLAHVLQKSLELEWLPGFSKKTIPPHFSSFIIVFVVNIFLAFIASVWIWSALFYSYCSLLGISLCYFCSIECDYKWNLLLLFLSFFIHTLFTSFTFYLFF